LIRFVKIKETSVDALLEHLNMLSEQEYFTIVEIKGSTAILDYAVHLSMLVEPDTDEDPNVLEVPGSSQKNPSFA